MEKGSYNSGGWKEGEEGVKQEMLRRALTTASRTSPSIPTPFHAYAAARTQSPRRGKAFIPELDRQARKDRNPRTFMEKGG